ncbi:MAG TPA: phosphomannomutase/phosphoglucomutase, partial [Desulfobacterales bacterium]|nr:phosphomannomutase/phosphoglucomutase [Desulfobacterales bacterium]
TPALYFSILHLNTDGGVMITGSHNPIEFNGFKLCGRDFDPDGVRSIYGREIQGLRERMEKKQFVQGAGTLSDAATLPAYIQMIQERIHLERALKVVVDAGNGSTSEIGPAILRGIGCEVIPLYCEVDGRFPNHLPDPTIPEYMRDLQRKVIETGADVGIGYDGDGDRIGVIDDTGKILWGDRLLALYARDVLSRLPGSTILFDVKCSQALVEDIKAHGGVPLMGRTGHSLIKAKMREIGAPVAGEMSGHMFFAQNYFGYDDALYASARLLEFLSRTSAKLSQIAAELPQYEATPEIRIDCADEEKFDVVKQIKATFRKDHDIIDVDGVRVLFGDAWALVRASNTQPVLVLRFEARTKERLREIVRWLVEALNQYPAVSGTDRVWKAMEGV